MLSRRLANELGDVRSEPEGSNGGSYTLAAWTKATGTGAELGMTGVEGCDVTAGVVGTEVGVVVSAFRFTPFFVCKDNIFVTEKWSSLHIMANLHKLLYIDHVCCTVQILFQKTLSS